MADGQTVEQQLLKILQFGGLKKDNLDMLVKIVAQFSQKGLRHIKAFPRGIPPVYEGIELRSVIESNQLNKFLDIILAEAQVNSVLVFPYGIPTYDIAEVVVGLGPTPVSASAGLAGPAGAAG